MSGNATKFAAEDLKKQLCALLGVAADAVLTMEGATLIARNGSGVGGGSSGNDAGSERGEKRLDLTQLKADACGDIALGRGHFNPPTIPLDTDGQGVPYATYGFAAQIAEVEVDMDLGTVKVLHIHAAHDVEIGRAHV